MMTSLHNQFILHNDKHNLMQFSIYNDFLITLWSACTNKISEYIIKKYITKK